MGNLLKKAGKAVSGTVNSIGKAVRDTANSIGKAGESFITSGTDAIKAIGRGDVGGILDSAARAASFGTVSLSNKGLINPASVAKTLGMSISAPAGAVTAGVAKKKGLLSQLRQGKGGEGGGSFTSTAKYPLGGETGKTGK